MSKLPSPLRRLSATLYWDIQLQARNGFYYVGALMLLMRTVLGSQVPTVTLAWLFPAYILTNLAVNTFYFMGGLLLLEKEEGTLEAQVITPLRHTEYLASKIITLTLLGAVENMAVVALTYAGEYRLAPLLAGSILMGTIFTLAGFLTVVRYDSINEYLLPSMLIIGLLSAPLLFYFELSTSWLFCLHPMQGGMILLKAAFQPVPIGQIMYAMAASVLWIGLLFQAGQRTFHRFVILKAGVH